MELCSLPANISCRFVNSPRSFRLRFCTVASVQNSTVDVSSPEHRGRMFILGMGFVGQFFAQELKNLGWTISGTCNDVIKKQELMEKGFGVSLFDAREPVVDTLKALKYYTHILVSIPPIRGIGDPMLQHEELLKSTLMQGNLQWLCYLSSTSSMDFQKQCANKFGCLLAGVYGDWGGAWIDENHPTKPEKMGKLRIAAEEGWLNLGRELGISTQVFRLGGIYGPGRSAVDTIIKQEPLSEGQKLRAGRQFTSRVHVEDICQALSASIRKPSFGVYNIVDDHPAAREEVFAYAWNLIEKKWPGAIRRLPEMTNELSFSKDGRCILRGDKRVSNERMKRELGVKLLYPTYKAGLKSIIDQMEPGCSYFSLI